MSERVPYPFKKPIPRPGLQNPGAVSFGTVQIEIKIQIDERGLMKVSINRPLQAVQILGLLLDAMQGQYQQMAQLASMIVDPNGKGVVAGAKEEKSNNGDGGDPGRPAGDAG